MSDVMLYLNVRDAVADHRCVAITQARHDAYRALADAATALHEARDLWDGLAFVADPYTFAEARAHYHACVDRVIAARAAMEENV